MPSSTGAAQPSQLIRRISVRVPIYLAFMTAVLLLSAGRLDWLAAWIYLGVVALTLLPTAIVLAVKSPNMVAERMARKKDAKGWDKIFVTLIAGLGPVATWIVAGLDLRFGWTGLLPGWVLIVGVLLYWVGQIVTVRAMLANRFFSAIVRIQKDRDHEPVTHGPYATVRHPGYVGATVAYLAVPMLLGSWWAFVPSLLSIALLVVRTALEDQTLQAELAGYREYAARVRFRLLPGIW